jgi:methylenetetrahydrofolate dehydrogenase (NADP+)/methenyltetrahydrofolate cyclohydrolase
MLILDGKAVAEARRLKNQSRVEKFKARRGRPPGLVVILVGDDPASQVYVGNKIKACEKAGYFSREERLPATASMEDVKRVIHKLNEDPTVDGMILQLPVPKHLKSDELIECISPDKDADCLTAANLGKLWSGRALTTPCTPWGVMAILEHYKINPTGMNAVVVGRSNIVGKPMAHLLVQANATVTICHTKTRDLSGFTREADLVVAAAGQPEFLGKGDFKTGAVVIDVGIHRKEKNGKKSLCGDVRLGEIEDTVSAATPVPGGVGPMTIAMLLENTLVLAEQH